ncbi:hypothetical protein DL240_03005 [Lujinxingia litoralis]|uniref:Flippase-like domain-containing protein n=2 Tax=Lujinxingia litoralis TaxID=2211119 RepID=A0A328CBG2_9DELT|nr:hypothetical protein DL240_03005 [Lujinxingia litoralis]
MLGSFLAASFIGVFFLWLAARGLPLADVRDYLASADYGRLGLASAAFVLLYIVCHGARVWRWNYLVRPLGEVSTQQVNRACALGFTAIVLMPLRLGEFVRPMVLARSSGLPASGLLATAVVERVMDGLIITALLFAALWTYQGQAPVAFARGAGLLSLMIFLPAIVMCVVAYTRRRWAEVIVEQTLGRISQKLAAAVSGLLMGFVEGFKSLVDGRNLGRFLGATALYWGTNALSMWALLSIGFDLGLNPWEIATVMAVLVIGIMVPAGPAMAGNFEFFMTRGMGLFVDMDVATLAAQVAVFAVLVHVLQLLVIVVPGAWVMARAPGLWRRDVPAHSGRQGAPD